MEDAWRLAEGVACKACSAHDEMLVYSSFSGATHVIANVGYLLVDLCRQGPQTMDSLIVRMNEAYEADRPEDLITATLNAVRQLQSLGILTQCTPP